MKKQHLSLLLLLACAWCVAQEFHLWARVTFDEPDLAFKDKSNMILPLPVQVGNEKAGSYVGLRFYPPNSGKSSLKPLALTTPDSSGASGHSITPGDDLSGGELMLLLDHFGELESAPDLMLALKLFVPEDDHGEYRLVFWNCSKPGRCDLLLSLKRGQWNFVRVPLISPGAIDAGDIVRCAALNSKNGSKRRWLVDDYVVWSGKDTEAPETVQNVKVTARGDDNLLEWKPSHDNLAIAGYEIHRGTVPNFQTCQATLAGKTIDPHFTDVCPMHENSFYKIIAIDYAGNSSLPSSPVRR